LPEDKLLETLRFHHVGLRAASTLQEFITEQAQRLGRQLAWRIQVGSSESVRPMVEFWSRFDRQDWNEMRIPTQISCLLVNQTLADFT
jgi:hypothetical protein